MARYKWNHLWLAGFLFFFAFQSILVIHYASKLESYSELDLSKPVSAASLLSRANVSARIKAYRQDVDRLNYDQFIRNTDIFGNWTINSSSPVFVIQSHDRVAYLEGLIGSLTKVKGIDRALLIFSHDIYSREINSVVANISFARVLQIYYPYSFQLFPKGYPGPDPNGTVLPAGYGRTPDLTQIKLHWIWKLTRVFRELRDLTNHTGPKIFLEEDHFVLPDILEVMQQVQTMKEKSCPACLVILGGYPKERLWHNLEWGVVRLTRFYASGNNMGMVLDRTFWNNVMKCAREFCTIDDYNWDWSLQHLHLQCFDEPVKILKPDGPRVWHLGTCGTHTKQSWKCKKLRIQESIRNVATLAKDNEERLFQPLKMISTLKRPLPNTPNPFGGWGDPRDHSLCMAILRDG